jgi:hypothetical protein
MEQFQVMSVSNNTDAVKFGFTTSGANANANYAASDTTGKLNGEWTATPEYFDGTTWQPLDWSYAPIPPNTITLGWTGSIPAVMPPQPSLTPDQLAQLIEEAFRKLKAMPEAEREKMGLKGIVEPEKKSEPEKSAKKKPRRMIQT